MLANSFKAGGSCIAGKGVVPGGYGGWIRPVSARESAEVWLVECLDENRAPPRLLDIMDVPLLDARPRNHQTENHIIDTTRPWVKSGELPWNALAHLIDRPTSLWVNSDSTRGGVLNCMSQVEAATQNHSLVLIRPENFILRVGSRFWDGKKTKTFTASFGYNRISYTLQLTDPIATSAYQSRAEGEYPLSSMYICVSLTEPWKKESPPRCHKLVAAIFSERPLS